MGRWRATRLLSKEGPVAWWSGVEVADGREVRLAVIAMPPGSELGDVARVQRAAQELEALEHPSVARVLGTATDIRGDIVVATEEVGGQSLADVIRTGPLGPERTARLGAAFFDALDAVHAAGFLHHDLVPDRVRLVDRAGD